MDLGATCREIEGGRNGLFKDAFYRQHLIMLVADE